jgi:hypothetical protein
VKKVRLVRLSDDVGDRVVVQLSGFFGDAAGGGHVDFGPAGNEEGSALL